MLVRPDRRDLALIGLYTGRIITGLGLVMLIPAALGVIRGEFNDALGLVIGAGLALLLGRLAEWRLATSRDLDWSHAMAAVALSWLVSTYLAAVPLYLSGHYSSFIDASFDAMSGFATAGLAVINDLDHLSDSINLWRHLMHFMGGQGLVLVALSLFGGAGGLAGLYVGEGREDRILPNVRRTASFIWQVALLYLLFGGAMLWAAVVAAGMPPVDGLLHAVMLFMAAFDTGGFAPTSASLGFYHSAVVEGAASILMVAGALSFALHYQLMRRKRLVALVRDLETRVLAVTVIGLTAVTMIGLARFGTYDSAEALFRRGYFHLLSAHTGTGFSTIPGRLFVTDWGALAPAMIVMAMAFGGMASSTTGGIKALRIGVLAKAVVTDVQRIVLPQDAVVVDSYHSGGRTETLRPAVVRTAVLITVLYLVLYFAGALLGMFYGYSIQEALFESTSAAAAVGLSVGIVGPDLELP
ncbi:MAG TPA: potassium transporter TrkG, partial [Euzebyales bacterium]|nr:potassium transporter TrkG [Euzebyales bacterium]